MRPSTGSFQIAVVMTRLPTAISRTGGALNSAAARDPQSRELARAGTARTRHHAEDATDVVIAAIAAETIQLVGGPHGADLHACGAPGCVLMFMRSDRRSAWCSPACGNRARQARHYARKRALLG